MYASTVASLACQTERSAQPRPLRSRCTARTPGSSSASCWARVHVASVLALSATVIRAGNGNPFERNACNRRILGPRSLSSL